MQKINSGADLSLAIFELESKRAEEARILREQFHLAYESVKPINLIKSTFKESVGSRSVQNSLISSSLGLTAGFLSKILFQFLAKSPVKKVIGTALMLGITNVVANNPEAVRSFGHKFLNIFRSKAARKAKAAEVFEIE